MASYLSIESATSTYVDEYVTTACMNRMILQSTFPAYHAMVIRHTMSVDTLISPTDRSEIQKYHSLVSRRLCK